MVDLPQPLSPTRATVCRESIKVNCLLVTGSTDDCSKIKGRNARWFHTFSDGILKLRSLNILNIRAGWI